MGAVMIDKDKRAAAIERDLEEMAKTRLPTGRGGYRPSFDPGVEARQSAGIKALRERLAALEDRVKWLEMGRR